jgi:hypothetical protein
MEGDERVARFVLLTSSDIAVLITVGFVLLVGLLLVLAIVRLVRVFLQQLGGSVPAALLNTLKNELDSGDLLRRLQEPRSLSGMDLVYSPQIQADFPELNLDELKARAERLAFTTLEAIGSEDFTFLSEKSDLYGSQLTNYLASLQSVGEKERFASITIHRLVLSDYHRTAGTCRIGFELAVGADYRRTAQDGRTIAGGDGSTQFRMSIEALYVQDPAASDQPEREALAVNCPNCGAPVASLGEKRCSYCGAAVEPVNIRTWTFSNFGLEL